jgi:flagella basal body P-ring formation protein FlgA
MTKRLLFGLFLLAFGLLGAGVSARADAPPAADAPSGVALRSTMEIKGSTIKLSDVFSGVPDGIDRAIAIAPAPGKSVTYDLRILTRLAEQYRLDWQPQSVGDRAVLTRAATRITQDLIRPAVIANLTAPDAPVKIDGKVEIAFDNKALEVDLPADKSPDFKLNNFDYDAQDRRFHADLVANAGNAPIVIPISGRVTVKRDVAIFAHKLEAGTIVNAGDLDWMTLTDDRITPDMITDASEAVGREVRRETPEGEPIHARDLSAPRLVKRGSLVTLKVETPLLLVTAQGRALQDGQAGEVVRVVNTQSNRVVEGTVASAGVVAVHTAQKVASVE